MEKDGKKLKLSYVRTMRAKLEYVTVATDGSQCLQLRWENGTVWNWINPEKVHADLTAAVAKLTESEAEVPLLDAHVEQIQSQITQGKHSPGLSFCFVGSGAKCPEKSLAKMSQSLDVDSLY